MNLLRLVQIPFKIGSSLMSTWMGLPVSLSPRRIPIGLKESLYPVSRLRKQVACVANVSKVSFKGKSAPFPGIPAQNICAAPCVSSLATASICEKAEETIFFKSFSFSLSSDHTSKLKCALTGSLPSDIASLRNSLVASRAMVLARL
ncbi:hypothetical protein D3C71_1013670 [compost metagenome]